MKPTVIVLLPVFWPNLPPLSLAVLKGFLTNHNLSVDVIDFNNYFFNKASSNLKKQWLISCNSYLEDNILDILKSDYSTGFTYMINKLLSYDVIGFSCYKSNFRTTLKIAQLLKTENPRLKIILGGPEITRQHFRLNGGLTREFGNISDFFVVGEGELPLLIYLTANRIDTRIAEFWEQKDLKPLPVPDYSDLDIRNYPKKSSISLVYSRGCPKKCRFCSERLLYKKFRLYPVDSIIKEIKKYKENGIENFIFHDSSINADLSALELLCDKIIENFGSIKWEAQFTIRKDMPERLLKKIKASGCYHLFVGLESGCDRTLTSMNKGFRAEDALGFLNKFKSTGLSFGVSIIIGYPGETYQDFIESLNFIIEHKDLIPKIEQVNPFVYNDGTDLPQESDHKFHPESMERTRFFINKIKGAGFKYTNAFILNLVDFSFTQPSPHRGEG